MNDKIRIAVDGPGGAGKSTIAKLLAAKLNIDYIDTGAMYRAIGYKVSRENINVDDDQALGEMMNKTEIDFSNGNIILDGEIVNDVIRTPEMSKMASIVSTKSVVREKLVLIQRNIAEGKSVIMDGRDIGTNVLKDAELKIFMTASSEERANRRYKELIEKGQKITFDEVHEDIKQRDYSDTHRKLNPLKAADDAVMLNTDGLNIEQVVEAILEEVEKHGDFKTI